MHLFYHRTVDASVGIETITSNVEVLLFVFFQVVVIRFATALLLTCCCAWPGYSIGPHTPAGIQ